MKLSGFFLSIYFCAFLVLPVKASIEVSNPLPLQGQTVEVTYIKVVNSKDQLKDSDLKFNGNNFKLFPVPDNSKQIDRAVWSTNKEESETVECETYHCLIAIPADLKPGKYDMAIGNEKKTLTVKDGLFPVQYLTLPKSKNNFLLSPGEEEAMNAAKAALSDKRLWKGTFTKPCQARTSAKFGLKRIVNGKLLKDYYHSGLDFAGSLGQPVYACGNGKVILAHKNFKLHGNVVAIDHGQGVVSIYIHLQKIAVKAGDTVKAGEQIGNVGATGRANGPHCI